MALNEIWPATPLTSIDTSLPDIPLAACVASITDNHFDILKSIRKTTNAMLWVDPNGT